MSTNAVTLVFRLFLLVSLASSARVSNKLTLNATDADSADSAGFNCRDMCVECNDGSKVFFGRNSNWWKAAPSLVLGGVSIAAASTGVGLIGVGAAAGAGAVIGVGAGQKAGAETHTSWTGNLPTTGTFCERVDILKDGVPMMSAAETKLGRVQNNKLKPYDEKNQARTDFTYLPSDKEAYTKGCKIVKAAGLKGSWSQFKSIFSSECASATAQGTMTCAGHSMLCGAAGVKGILEMTDFKKCMDATGQTPKCYPDPK